MADAPTTLAEALLALQADLPTVAKRQTAKVETTKGSYSYKYAGLQAVSSAILPRLNQLGLIFTARPTLVDGRPVLLCELIHVASGERLPAEYPIAVAPNAPAQAIGSAISYGRRYCLCAMVGVVAEEDDDGRAASMRYDEPEPPRRERQPAESASSKTAEPRMISDPQLKKLGTMMTRARITDRQARLDYCIELIQRPITTSKALTQAEAHMVIESLEAAEADSHNENPEGTA